MRRPSNASPESRRLRLAKCLLALVWLAIIAICLLHKDEFTLEGILNYTPRQPALAVLLPRKNIQRKIGNNALAADAKTSLHVHGFSHILPGFQLHLKNGNRDRG